MYACLMNVRPVRVANLDNKISFPFNLRFGRPGWKLLFMDDKLPDASAGSSAAWTRGQYVAKALGHCAECHTPPGKFRQLKALPLTGSTLGRVTAPDITPATLAARGCYAAGHQGLLCLRHVPARFGLRANWAGPRRTSRRKRSRRCAEQVIRQFSRPRRARPFFATPRRSNTCNIQFAA
jgi:hypothetical protein